jgi:hypothetical protein
MSNFQALMILIATGYIRSDVKLNNNNNNNLICKAHISITRNVHGDVNVYTEVAKLHCGKGLSRKLHVAISKTCK